jgi:serine/threonine protein kinase
MSNEIRLARPRAGAPISGLVADGRFEVLELLESGAMGDVYLVRQLSLGMTRAMKVIKTELEGQERESRRFRREALALSRLTHDNIVQVIDFGRLAAPRDQHYLVMEYVEGINAQAAVDRGGRLPPRQAVRLLRQLADALDHAHDKGIVHRDLKPANILLRGGSPHDDGARIQAKIVDFGMVRIVTDETLTKITAAEQIMGTPRFMAPEQCRQTQVGPAADIYALGGIAFFLLCGTPVFRARSVLEMITAHARRPPERVSRRCPELGLSPTLDDLVLRCLDKCPEARPTAAELKRTLDRVGEDVASGPYGETHLAQPAPPADNDLRRRGVLSGPLTSSDMVRLSLLIWSSPAGPCEPALESRPVLEALFNQISTQLMNLARRMLASPGIDDELRGEVERLERLERQIGALELDVALCEAAGGDGPRLAALRAEIAELGQRRDPGYRALFPLVVGLRSRLRQEVTVGMLDDLENLVEQYLRLGGVVASEGEER